MRRFAVAAVMVALGAAAFVPSAFADKPFKETDVSGTFVAGAGICGFPVEFQPTRQDRILVFEFSDGRSVLNFAFAGVATNLVTGESVNINLSGHNTFVVKDDGSSIFTATGGTVLFEPGSLTFVRGRIVDLFNAEGDLVSETITGHTVDLCEELADD